MSYTWGREANTTYNENTAGRLPYAQILNVSVGGMLAVDVVIRRTLDEQPVWPQGDRSAQLPRGISPWSDSSNSTPIKGVWVGEVADPGAADNRVGGYDWVRPQHARREETERQRDRERESKSKSKSKSKRNRETYQLLIHALLLNPATEASNACARALLRRD